MEPVVRTLDVGFGHTKFVSSVDGSEVRCAHFPSVTYPTESDETTDPMGGRRKTVGIPIDGLIYEVGPDIHLAADIFNAKQMHERYSETPEYLAMLRGALHYMKLERIDLLVVGLPVAAFKAKKRAALDRLVLGKHDVGRGKIVHVERAPQAHPLLQRRRPRQSTRAGEERRQAGPSRPSAHPYRCRRAR